MAKEPNTTETEEWRDVPNWEGYRASTLGRIQGPRKILSQHIERCGYARVAMRHRPTAREKCVLVHKIVAEAFLGPSNGLQVNHKNNVRHDNRLENLEYLTASQNSQYRRNFGTFPTGANNGRARLTEIKVAEIRKRHANGELQKDLAREFDVAHGTIWWVVHNGTWYE